MSHRTTPSILSLALVLAMPTFAACTTDVGGAGPSAGSTNGSGGSTGATGGSGGTAAGAGVGPDACNMPAPPKAPLRRLTRFEYNNTVRYLAKVTDSPANLFPPENVGSGFGT